MSERETAPAADGQRIDRWLWFARIFKSRSLATKIVEAGVRITRAGETIRTTKPSYALRPGDVVTLEAHDRIRVLEVLSGGVRRGPASEAQTLYKDLSDPAAEVRAKKPVSPAPASRPSKKDRRDIGRFKGEGRER